MICFGNDGCEMKVLLLGRFFVFAPLVEWLTRGTEVEVPREELQWRLGVRGGGY